MHEFAGIIMTPKSKPLSERMKKFCSYYGEYKPNAFCDGWATIAIDSDEHLHAHGGNEDDWSVYCPTLESYCTRYVENPYYGQDPNAGPKYYSADISVLVTPSDKVYYDEEAEEKLIEYCKKHPDWGIYILNIHV